MEHRKTIFAPRKILLVEYREALNVDQHPTNRGLIVDDSQCFQSKKKYWFISEFVRN